MFAKISIFFIKYVYQKFLRKINIWFNKKRKIFLFCAYYPTCSEYTILALKKYGFLKGWKLGINRIRKCKNIVCEQSCIDYP
jgi:hypothetical protein